MQLNDHRCEIADGARITRDGYLVAEALVARANNVQTYRAAELGLTDRDPDSIVRVFRPETEIFAKDALASLAHRPVTINHPGDDLSADNWKAHAVGDVGDEMIRDGERVRVPIKVMDAAAIDAIRTTHRELSLGYRLNLDLTPGEHEGQTYDAVARSIRYNHLAAVRAARGGPELRVIDERPSEPPMKIKIGDAEVDATNGEAVRIAVDALNVKMADATTAKDKALADVAALTSEKAVADAKIVTLEAQLAAAKLTPAKLRDAAKAYAVTLGMAKALGVTVADDLDEPAIMKAVVSSKLGDLAKDWGEQEVAASFASLTKDVKAADTTVVPIHSPAAVNDETEKAYSEMVSGLQDAWKPKAANA